MFLTDEQLDGVQANAKEQVEDNLLAICVWAEDRSVPASGELAKASPPSHYPHQRPYVIRRK